MRSFFAVVLLCLAGAVHADPAMRPGQYLTQQAVACEYWGDHERITSIAGSGDTSAAAALITELVAVDRCQLFASGETVFVDKVASRSVCMRRPGATRCGWTMNFGFTR